VSAPELVAVTVDGREVHVPPGTGLVETALAAGVEIPVFCYEPRLGEPLGACRMCLVEVEGTPKLQAGCTLTAQDGMVVRTARTSQQAAEGQNATLEFILVNHPLDCPVCDKGGECPLQNQTMSHGNDESRFHDKKRTFPKPIAISSRLTVVLVAMSPSTPCFTASSAMASTCASSRSGATFTRSGFLAPCFDASDDRRDALEQPRLRCGALDARLTAAAKRGVPVWLIIRAPRHIFGYVVNLATCKRKRKVQQAIIAEMIRAVKCGATGRPLLVATVTVHRPTQVDPSLHAVVGKASHHSRYAVN